MEAATIETKASNDQAWNAVNHSFYLVVEVSISSPHQTDLFHRRPNNIFPLFLRVHMVCEHPLDSD